MLKVIQTIFRIIRIIIIILLILFSSFICIQRFSNNNVAIFGYRMFTVATGSMVPMYNVGDILLCKEVDPSTLKVGDDITYMGMKSTFKDKLITHRIIKIAKNDNGEYIFQTQGIATTSPDPAIKEDQIYGKIITEIEILSWVYKQVTTPVGLVLMVIVPILLIIASEILTSKLEKVSEKKRLEKERKLTSEVLQKQGIISGMPSQEIIESQINMDNPQLQSMVQNQDTNNKNDKNDDIDEYISF